MPGPLGLFCTALLASAFTLSVHSTTSYSQYGVVPGDVPSTIPIVTEKTGALAANAPAAVPATGAATALAAAPEHHVQSARDNDAGSNLVVRVKKGETLMDILTKSGVPAGEAEDAITSLHDVYNPRQLKTGQEVTLVFAPPAEAFGSDAIETLGTTESDLTGTADAAGTFLALKIQPEAGREIATNRDSTGAFSAAEVHKALNVVQVRSAGVIQSSLFDAAQAAGLPPKALAEMIHAFSYDVDFQRDIQPGDSFEVLYEKLADKDGNSLVTGKIDYAELVLSGQRLALYHYTTKDGVTDYFNQNGDSVRKALLRTPIDGARLSSGFGMRNHPILGYTRMHRGVDFAAPKGTPIFAAGSGVVVQEGRNRGYGNYIEIRHDPDFHTGYSHLSRFAAGIHSGTRVAQGQIIGYVGMTGLATGPHLHYEVIRDNEKVNPLSVNLPSGKKLRGAEFDEFAVAKAKIDTMVANLPIESKVASSQ